MAGIDLDGKRRVGKKHTHTRTHTDTHGHTRTHTHTRGHTHTHCMFFGFESEVIGGIDVPESPKRPGDEKLNTIFLRCLVTRN